MTQLKTIKPTDKALKAYYATLQGFADQQVTHVGAVETAFQRLLNDTAKSHGWMLVPKLTVKHKGRNIIPDGTIRDDFFHRGYWEAKDTNDDLQAEISKKIANGYPLKNIIFEDTRRAVLFQNGEESLRADLTKPGDLADLLNAFYGHIEPDFEGFEKAVDEFKERVPDLGRALAEKIAQAHTDNARFQKAFDDFFKLCQTALNPNIRREAVDEMLVQHLLTERLIRKIFDNPEFTQRNVIAAEVEHVIAALVSKSFNRDEFLKSLDRFYSAIENAARRLEDFKEKQELLNTVYERFFQGFSVKVADTHGIIYTPQPIVDFMCASVAEVLDTEFGLSLGSPEVQILDPCTGTGNFMVNLLGRIPRRDLPRMYREQLFANEVMLMPYYIAALNIEHAYYELTRQYEPFDGLCFVDTLDMAEHHEAMFQFMTERNTVRVERQKDAPITVILGNPPYNANQLNENDNNKNREYPVIDDRIRATYVKETSATKTKCYDPYVRFFRWATDRLGTRDGIVCLITNNSFVHKSACDGLRNLLPKDFSRVYHLDLCGDVRENPTLSGTAYNVFGIQVGVGITIAVRRASHPSSNCYYHAVPLELRREEKLKWLSDHPTISRISWDPVEATGNGSWFRTEGQADFGKFTPLSTKEAKQTAGRQPCDVFFATYSLGLSTNRDRVVYDFQTDELLRRVEAFCENYNAELARYQRHEEKIQNLDEFLDTTKLKWSRNLKRHLRVHHELDFDPSRVRQCLYRPFTKQRVYFAEVVIDELAQLRKFFPTPAAEKENVVMAVSDIGYRAEQLSALVTNSIVDQHLCASLDGHQCFPFYVYAEDGIERRENITDWALGRFREHYGDGSITKWDIFYYVYGLLHHPGYRARFADNLKRELPRIPFAPADNSPSLRSARVSDPAETHDRRSPRHRETYGHASGSVGDRPQRVGDRPQRESGFWAFASAGKQLAELHLNYEQLEPFPLRFIETPGVPLSYRVEDKMRLSKDKSAVTVNPSLTLVGIPSECFNYRLGNRSGLDWVIDQYQITTDKRSGIHSDPNRSDDEQYIVRLVGQVVRVSIETTRIVEALPARFSE